MSVQLRYFASLREQMAREGDRLELAQPMSVSAVWQAANPGRALPENMLMAINQEYANAAALVHDGDEVAFFPPVSGG